MPYHYSPRSYQRQLFAAFDEGKQRLLTCWHRRAGKDLTWLNATIREMYRRPGVYIHLFPQLKRGRKIIWEGKNREGQSFLDYFPEPLVKRRREDEMMIEMKAAKQHGNKTSLWRIEGVENINSVIGMNPVGIVFSEYSQMRPQAWDLIRPILLENGGWAGFNYTPRGKNFAYDLHMSVRNDPAWFCSVLTVSDTKRDAEGEDGRPIVTPEMLDGERRQGMREALLQQEFYVSYEAGSALQFIPGEYVQAAFDREKVPWDWAPRIVGVDVGRNRDRSVILLRQGGQIIEKIVIHPYQSTDNPTEHVCGVLSRLCQTTQPSCVFVDGVGVGAGVIDRMRSLGFSVVGVLGNAQASDVHYYNLRASMWGAVREWLRTEGQLTRGRDDVLGAELQWPQWRWKGDKEWLTPKDELEEVATGGDDDEGLEYVSPDEADALALTFAAPVTMQARTRRPPAQGVSSTEWDVFTGAAVRTGVPTVW